MKKILLAIGIFLINYSAITQSNSCTISVTNVQDNTECGINSPNGYNGYFEVFFTGSANNSGSNISVQCINSYGYSIYPYINSGPSGTIIQFWNVEPDTYNLTISYDDGNGNTCNPSTIVTIADYSTSNITVTAPIAPSQYPPINGHSCENSTK